MIATLAQATNGFFLDANIIFSGLSTIVCTLLMFMLRKKIAAWDGKADMKDMTELKRMLEENAKQDQELRKIVEENARQLAVYMSGHDTVSRRLESLEERVRSLDVKLAAMKGATE